MDRDAWSLLVAWIDWIELGWSLNGAYGMEVGWFLCNLYGS